MIAAGRAGGREDPDDLEVGVVETHDLADGPARERARREGRPEDLARIEKRMAEIVKANRRPAAPENVLAKVEGAVSEAISASLTIPVVLPAVGGSWRATMAVWAAPVLLIGLAVGVVPVLEGRMDLASAVSKALARRRRLAIRLPATRHPGWPMTCSNSSAGASALAWRSAAAISWRGDIGSATRRRSRRWPSATGSAPSATLGWIRHQLRAVPGR